MLFPDLRLTGRRFTVDPYNEGKPTVTYEVGESKYPGNVSMTYRLGIVRKDGRVDPIGRVCHLVFRSPENGGVFMIREDAEPMTLVDEGPVHFPGRSPAIPSPEQAAQFRRGGANA